jgi:aryl-alcohol dehydrogenase-like predicted oxidoreductase
LPEEPEEYFAQEYLEREIFRPEEVAAGCHCMAPRYLENQLDRSLANLGVSCVDVFYLHNPETQLSEVPAEEFRRRLHDAFAFMESAVAAGKIGAYGLATWNAFRENVQSPGFMSLPEVEAIAREVGGENHHLRFLQLPLNLAMPEALLRPNQTVNAKTMSMVQAARALGITMVTSASLLQGQLTRNLPPYMAQALRGQNDAERALQFARSVPGVTTALAGMSHVEHVRANLSMVTFEPAARDEFLKLFEQRTP